MISCRRSLSRRLSRENPFEGANSFAVLPLAVFIINVSQRPLLSPENIVLVKLGEAVRRLPG